MFWDYMGAGSAVVRCCVWVMNVGDWEGSGFGCWVHLRNAMDYFLFCLGPFAVLIWFDLRCDMVVKWVVKDCDWGLRNLG